MPRNCSCMLRTAIPIVPRACYSLSFENVWWLFASHLLNISGTPEWKALVGLQMTRTDLHFPPMSLKSFELEGTLKRHLVQLPWWCEQGTWQVWDTRQWISNFACPSFHILASFAVSRWTEQAAAAKRVPPCWGSIFFYILPAWKATRVGKTILPDRHIAGKVVIFCVLGKQCAKQ